MCGIAGLYDLTGRGRTSIGAVRAMCDAIRHRGPDGEGVYAPSAQPDLAFGMRRLSIIDVEGSDQPLYNEDRSIALVFNGEIYNYRELQKTLIAQGHTLRTRGDGETILHLYEQHGLDLFAHLRGMYAFALWDANAARLVLAVDHIGMKPLYLAEHDGILRFASEVKALFSDGSVPRELNLDVLDTYLAFGYMIGAETLFRGVRRLMPGHALIAEGGQTRLHEFYRFGADRIGSIGTRDYVPDETIIESAREKLAESVRLHLRSDVPLGLFLSGGVDSAAMLAEMAQHEADIKTFTVGYAMQSRDNELEQARRIAGHFGADHHERIITADDWWRGFESYIYHHDEPNANPSAVSLLLLSEMTAQHVKVVLTGLGGDELFGGYPHHHNLAWIIDTQKSLVGRALRPLESVLGAVEPLYPMLKRWRYVGALPTYLPKYRHGLMPREEGLRREHAFDGLVWTDALREKLYADPLMAAWRKCQHKEHAYADIVARSLRHNPTNTAQALVINTWLHGNALLNCDKVTMAHSLEARVPFFDPAMLAFAAETPPELRMRSNKYILREALRPLLPEWALERPKQPFQTPILDWFAGDLRPRIEARLLDSGAFIRPYFQRHALEGLLRGHFSGRAPQVEVVFRLLTLESWGRRFMANA